MCSESFNFESDFAVLLIKLSLLNETSSLLHVLRYMNVIDHHSRLKQLKQGLQLFTFRSRRLSTLHLAGGRVPADLRQSV